VSNASTARTQETATLSLWQTILSASAANASSGLIIGVSLSVVWFTLSASLLLEVPPPLFPTFGRKEPPLSHDRPHDNKRYSLLSIDQFDPVLMFRAAKQHHAGNLAPTYAGDMPVPYFVRYFDVSPPEDE